MVTFDRPGYGHSPNREGRVVGDAAGWCEQIADHLGIDRFALMGTSGGGPHAAAAAALLGDRVTRLCVSVGLGPAGHPGFDVRAGMVPETVEEIEAAQAGDESLRAFVERTVAEEAPFLGWLDRLPVADVEVWGRADVRREERAEGAEMMRHGIEGWVEDDLAFFHRPWRCDLHAVTAPTLLVYGELDVLVPPSHGAAYRDAIGHGQLSVLPRTGHWMRDHEGALLQWLTSPGVPAAFDG